MCCDISGEPQSNKTIFGQLIENIYPDKFEKNLKSLREFLQRNKIPLFEEDRLKLKMIAKYYKEKEGINVSPGQIASALVHADVSRIATSKVTSALKHK